MIITDKAIALGHKLTADEQRRTLRMRQWYRALRAVRFTPWQSKKIAIRLAGHDIAEVQTLLGADNFAIMLRGARP